MRVGKLIWIPKVGTTKVIEFNKPFALLNHLKTRLIKESQYEKSRGKLKVTY